MFQRKVYDGAMRTLTEYRRHLDGRSSDTADENRQRCAWLSLRDCGSRCQKSFWPPYRKCIPFQTWPLSVRVALASQIRWHIRAELTCDVGYGFDPVKISREAFRPTTAVDRRLSFEVRRSRVEKVELSTRALSQSKYAIVFPVTNRRQLTTSGMRNLSRQRPLRLLVMESCLTQVVHSKRCRRPIVAESQFGMGVSKC
jgi:hypothetical protein